MKIAEQEAEKGKLRNGEVHSAPRKRPTTNCAIDNSRVSEPPPEFIWVPLIVMRESIEPINRYRAPKPGRTDLIGVEEFQKSNQVPHEEQQHDPDATGGYGHGQAYGFSQTRNDIKNDTENRRRRHCSKQNQRQVVRNR